MCAHPERNIQDMERTESPADASKNKMFTGELETVNWSRSQVFSVESLPLFWQHLNTSLIYSLKYILMYSIFCFGLIQEVTLKLYLSVTGL